MAGRGRRRLRGDPVGGRQCRALGGDAGRIVVGGDSAGGNLAAVTALMARDRGGPALAAQLLLYPVIAADFDTESYRLFGKGFYNPRPAMQWYWDQYVPVASRPRSPLRLTAARDLRGLPPAVVVIAGHDPLRDEGLPTPMLLRRPVCATVRCRYDGGIHGFMTMPMLDLAQRARVEVCRELSRLSTEFASSGAGRDRRGLRHRPGGHPAGRAPRASSTPISPSTRPVRATAA